MCVSVNKCMYGGGGVFNDIPLHYQHHTNRNIYIPLYRSTCILIIETNFSFGRELSLQFERLLHFSQ